MVLYQKCTMINMVNTSNNNEEIIDRSTEPGYTPYIVVDL